MNVPERPEAAVCCQSALTRVISTFLVVCAVLILGHTSAGARQDADLGAIEGQVIDARGHGLAGVQVTAYPEGPVAGILPTGTSGADGRFLLTSVLPGRVVLVTSKEEDGYPNTTWAAVADPRSDRPWVTVLPGATIREITIRLGPPTGVLRGKIVDDHGRPVPMARVLLYPEDEPDATLSSSVRPDATFVFALPDRYYTLKVTAPSFVDWSSEDADTVPTHHIRLAGGTKRHLVVRLMRTDR